MKYLLLICNDKNQTPPSPAEMESMFAGHRKLGEELRAAGKVIAGERLRPDSDTARVRSKAGQRQVTDGPFAETKEALGGFYLIECADRKEAVEWAKKIPLRDGSHVDVREIWPM